MKHIASYTYVSYLAIYYMATGWQARTQEVGMGVLIYSIVEPRRGDLGAQPPADVAYLTKHNPENPLLTHTVIKCN